MLRSVPFSFSHAPFPTTLPLLDDETRKAALQRTQQTLRDLIQISRDLDLPVASLPQVIEIYVSSAREVVVEKERAEARQMIEMFATTLIYRLKERSANVRHRMKHDADAVISDASIAAALEEVENLVEDARNIFLDDTKM